MTSRLVNLCIDANDVPRLARFWATALQWEIEDETADEIGVQPTDGTPFRLLFLPVPEPKVGKNRVHLDLTSTSIDDQNELVEKLLALGGRHIDIGQDPNDTHVVLADPEGNELCIIDPGNKFLAGTGRLGAINSDGLRATGYFWSKVLGWPLVWDQDEETAIPRSGPHRTAHHMERSAADSEDGQEQDPSRRRAAGRRGSAVGGRANHGSRSEADRHR